jgi:2-polyprenyl-6-methoxyphenol hydroxylase-like FAD-dependent oxidoreductase
VLWMRISRHPNDPEQTLGRVRSGRILVTINRGEYWQCAYVIPKGGFDAIRARGLPSFREDLVKTAPFLGTGVDEDARVHELAEWDDVKLLSVAVDRLRSWSRPGLLCIGDSAHAMSPVGGVGINLAIQDAVAAANILAHPLSEGAVSDELLQQVQHRREFPTRMTQRLQIFAHKRVLGPTLGERTPITQLPLALKLLERFPILRRIPARVIGLGFRPEHIHTPDSISNSSR